MGLLGGKLLLSGLIGQVGVQKTSGDPSGDPRLISQA